MIRRPRRTAPAVLVALIVLAACIAVTVSLIQRLTGTREYISYDSVAGQLHGLTWNDPVVAGVAVAAIVLGAVLILAAVLPGRTLVLPLNTGAGGPAGTAAGVRRRDLRAVLRVAADSVGGVRSSRVKIKRTTVTVIARTDRYHRDGLAEEICAAVGARVEQIGCPAKRVRARVHGPAPAKREPRNPRPRTTSGPSPTPSQAGPAAPNTTTGTPSLPAGGA